MFHSAVLCIDATVSGANNIALLRSRA